MVYNREDAAKRAEASAHNVPGTCQNWVRTMFGVAPVGDVDHDGDADAIDGWKSEPANKRHTDRRPPRGVPMSWSGGTHGYGHRAISLGGGKVRSTDAAGQGNIGTVDISWFERNWGMKYLGWSETVSGVQIPIPIRTQMTRGARVDSSIEALTKANRNAKSKQRKALTAKAIAILRRLKGRPKR